jgi:multidrug resistance efflux pump
MRAPLALPLLLAPLACAAPGAEEPAAQAGPGAQAAPAPQNAGKGSPGLVGLVAPAELEALALWPEAWKGELVVLEVLPGGTPVQAGEVVARLDGRALDEELAKARLELGSARVEHQGLLAKHALEDEAAAAALEQARAGLDRARRALESWLGPETAFEDRGNEIQSLRERARIDDQVDELDQLEKMYAADELVDATEGIVLKRARRDLESTRAAVALSEDRRAHQIATQRKLEREGREEAVRMQALALGRLERSQAVAAASRADAALRSQAQLAEKDERVARLERDHELLVLRAPRAGVLLHGKPRVWRPGRSPGRLERGGSIPTRAEALFVAAPERAAIAVDLPESALAGATDGARVKVRPVAEPERELTGRLVLPALPSPKGEEAVWEATVELDGPAEGLELGGRAKVELVR